MADISAREELHKQIMLVMMDEWSDDDYSFEEGVSFEEIPEEFRAFYIKEEIIVSKDINPSNENK